MRTVLKIFRFFVNLNFRSKFMCIFSNIQKGKKRFFLIISQNLKIWTSPFGLLIVEFRILSFIANFVIFSFFSSQFSFLVKIAAYEHYEDNVI